MTDTTRTDFGERRFGRMNWIGLWTLYRKEVRRFLKVAFQTVAAPIITTVLYLTVFLVAFSGGGRDPMIDGVLVPYAAFLPPGLIMMAILSNAFQNASSSLIIAKVQGSVVDILMPPLSAAELTIAFVAGAATRGLLVGAVTWVTILVFMAISGAPLGMPHPLAVLYFALTASIMLGAVGAIAGMWAEKFDQLALIANFVITPLTFLSGTFFSVNKPTLPGWVADVSAVNPLFYLIDGFRFGFIGVADGALWTGVIVSGGLSIVLCGLTYRLFRSGYKLKA
ncbi:ABC-2 type transporter [Parvularcula bermudensis HTCC2503]|uniref:Transport permease protein n=1 Tax=Parvularcula bermudensis (strain ATCC BAA-594 / HTCC2503 / KCTC 12087) TaxID=314260 RepID=E0TGB6_PARBH|nr:ABC transporter permease [Parvularcula bermudensis]ADM09159.1 ABC-2 type transporter [Parvularcula bermudensis HTCC2503]